MEAKRQRDLERAAEALACLIADVDLEVPWNYTWYTDFAARRMASDGKKVVWLASP